MTKVWKMKRTAMVVALALVGFACADGVGQMLEDAGQMLEDAGVSMQDGSVPDAGAQDTPVECGEVGSEPWGDGGRADYYSAEFDANPGQTEVTVCQDGTTLFSRGRPTCYRGTAGWHEGTSTGFVSCGVRYFDAEGNVTVDGTAHIRSITVHR